MAIDIRIVGSANLSQVQQQLGKVAIAAKAANEAMVVGNRDSKGRFADGAQRAGMYRQLMVEQSALRENTLALTRANGDFTTSSMKLGSETDKMVERIQKQKVSWRDYLNEMSLVKETFEEQRRLQHSYVKTWGTSRGGNMEVDMIIPNFDIPKRGWADVRQEAFMYNELMKSISTQTVNWGKNTQWAGRQLMAGITYPLILAGGLMAKTAYDIDKGLTQITKVYGDSGDAIQETDEQIRKAAMSTASNLTKYGQSVEDTLEIQSQLASTGVTGTELQASTAAVTKARLLGELDIQDAMKATINLQETYGMGTEELANAFNYMNQMENETSLTMQDFVEGIPKISGIMRSLGADFEDSGILLAAMKTAGIDAKEGGNAVKSMVFKDIAPSAKALKVFSESTGQSLETIVDTTKGDPIKTLQAIGKAIEDLPGEEQVAVIKEVFGIHQGSKALGMITALTDKSKQMTKAFEIAGSGPGEWAETARGELETLQKSDWVRVTAAINNAKIALAGFGEVILHTLAPALEFVGDKLMAMSEWFKGLPAGVKHFTAIALALLAVTGPLIMLVGLFANLFGNGMKAITAIVGLFAKGELLTKQQKAAQLADKARTDSIKAQTAAMNDLTAAYRRQFDAERALVGGYLQKRGDLNIKADMDRDSSAKGKSNAAGASALISAGTVKSSVSTGGNSFSNQSKAMKDAATNSKVASNAMTNVANKSDEARGSWKNIAFSAGSLVTAAATMGMMVTESGSLLNNMSNVIFFGGLLGPSILEGLKKAGVNKYLTDMAVKINNWGLAREAAIAGAVSKSPKASGALNGITKGAASAKGAIAGLGASIAAMAGPIAIAAVAIGGLFYILHKRAKEAREEQDAYNNSLETFAKVAGADLPNAMSLKAGEKHSAKDWQDLAKEAIKSDEKLAGYINGMSASQRTKEEAIRFGLEKGNEARARGLTPEEATRIARIAMVSVKNDLSAEAEILIDANMFVDVKQVKLNEVDRVRRRIQEAADEASNFNITGQTDVTYDKGDSGHSLGVAKMRNTSKLQAAVAASWQQISAAEGKERDKYFQKASTDAYVGFQDMFEGIKDDRQKAAMEKLGITDGQTWARWLDDNGGIHGFKKAMEKEGAGFSDAQIETLQREAEVVKKAITFYLMEINGWSQEEAEKRLKGIGNFNQILGDLDIKPSKASKGAIKNQADAYKAQMETMRKTAKITGNELSYSQQLAILNQHRLAVGLKKTNNINDGFSESLKKSKKALDDDTASTDKNAASKDKAARAAKSAAHDIFSGGLDASGDVSIKYKAGDEESTKAAAEAYTNAYKSSLANARDKLFDEIMQGAEEMHQERIDQIDRDAEEREERLNKEQQAKEEEFQRRQEAIDKAYEKRQEKFESRWDSIMEKFESKWERKSDAFADKWDDTMERFKKKSDQAKKALEAQYDSRIKKIEKAIKAEQDAEAVRQRIFEKEKARIQHLADMANRSIDINMAINTGELDEAAKMVNDAQAAIELYETEDTGEISQSASDKRIEGLESQKERIGKQKDAAIARLEARQRAEEKNLEHQRKMAEKTLEIAKRREQKILEAQKKREQKSLELQRETARKSLERDRKTYAKSLEDRRKSDRKSVASKKKAEQDRYALAKRSAERELDFLKSYTPRNRAELNAHIKKLEKAYGEYGGRLKTRGKSWGKHVGDTLYSETRKAKASMQNDIDWKRFGDVVSNRMIKGAFNMSYDDFAKWVGGGAKPKSKSSKKSKSGGSSGKPIWSGKTGVNSKSIISRHSGGVIDGSKGSRVGFSGNSQSQSEVTINALKGESVLNRRATRALGKDGVDALNEGRVPSASRSVRGTDYRSETGDAPAGIAGMFAAGIAHATSLAIQQGIMTVGARQTAIDAAATSMGAGDWDGTKFGAFWKALALQESGGNYSAVNSMTGALGKYQVLPGNVNRWAQMFLGRSMSPAEFLASPALQDELVKAALGSMYRKNGPRGAAAEWYSGNPSLHMSTRPQPGGPSIKAYVDSIMAKMEKIMASGGGGTVGAPPGKGDGVWPGMGWKRQFQLVKKAFPSRAWPTLGQTTGGGHAKNSYHYKGRAVDLGSAADPSVPLDRLFNWLYNNFGKQSTQIIYGPKASRNILNGKHFNYGASTNAGHMHHVHWAMKNGGMVPGRGVGDRTPVMAEPGEFMMRKKAVERVGPDYLRMLNSDRFINMPAKAATTIGSASAGAAVDNSYSPTYNISIDASGNAQPQDVAKEVEDVLIRLERRKGFNRRIGN